MLRFFFDYGYWPLATGSSMNELSFKASRYVAKSQRPEAKSLHGSKSNLPKNHVDLIG